MAAAYPDKIHMLDYATLEEHFPAGYKSHKGGEVTVPVEWLYEFANNITATEREECAKLCEKSDRYRGDYFAEKIRGRGKGIWWTI